MKERNLNIFKATSHEPIVLKLGQLQVVKRASFPTFRNLYWSLVYYATGLRACCNSPCVIDLESVHKPVGGETSRTDPWSNCKLPVGLKAHAVGSGIRRQASSGKPKNNAWQLIWDIIRYLINKKGERGKHEYTIKYSNTKNQMELSCRFMFTVTAIQMVLVNV